MHGNFPGARRVLESSPFVNFPTPPHSVQKPNMTQPILQLTKSSTIKQKANLDLMPESLAVESLLLTTASSQLKAPPSTSSSPDTLHPSSSKHHRDQAFGKPSPETRHKMVYFKQVLSKLHSAVKMWVRMTTVVYTVPERVMFFKSSQALQDISSWTNTLFALFAGDRVLYLGGILHKVYLNAWNTTPLLPSPGNIKFPN